MTLDRYEKAVLERQLLMKEESDLIRQTLYGKYEHAIFPYYVWQELFTLFDLSSEAPTRKVKIRDSLEMVDFNTKIE